MTTKMSIKAKILAIGFLLLVLQLGLAHTAQHDLHLSDLASQTIEHDDSDCLLADTPQAKSALPIINRSFTTQASHDVPPRLARHASTQYSKSSPRAPPVSL